MTTIAITIVGRATDIRREIKERSQEIIPKIKQGAIGKSPIFLSQYWQMNN